MSSGGAGGGQRGDRCGGSQRACKVAAERTQAGDADAAASCNSSIWSHPAFQRGAQMLQTRQQPPRGKRHGSQQTPAIKRHPPGRLAVCVHVADADGAQVIGTVLLALVGHLLGDGGAAEWGGDSGANLNSSPAPVGGALGGSRHPRRRRESGLVRPGGDPATADRPSAVHHNAAARPAQAAAGLGSNAARAVLACRAAGRTGRPAGASGSWQ